jgi:haloacetate dehalogenase
LSRAARGNRRTFFDGFAVDVVGGVSIPSGRHMAEEAPEELAASLLDFLR